MAVKFSEFSAKLDASVDVTEVVGYLTSGELNVRIPPANLDTTYVVSTGNAGASPTINLQGTKAGQASAISPSTVSLTGSGATLLAGNGSTTIDFASTAYVLSATDNADPAQNTPVVLTGTGGGDSGTDTVNLIGASGVGVTSSSGTITITGPGSGSNTTYTVDVPAATTNLNLAGSDGSNDAITLVGGTDIQLVRDSASQITINSQATGDTYTLQAGTKAGSSVPLQLDAATGTDSTVNLTEGTGITLTQNSATEITIDSAAGISISKQQFTGNNSTTDFSLTTASGCTVDNLAIYIAGVYQNKLDASSAANFTVGAGTNPTLQFVSGGTPTAPPTTATNGIEVVITR